MNYFVTGGGGFLGSAIIEELFKVDPEAHITSFSRHSYPELVEKGVTCLQGDLSMKTDVEKLNLSGFDIIFHVAAKAGVWGRDSDFFRINLEGSKNIFDKACEDEVPTFIYTSSPSVVFGEDDIIEGNESLPYPNKFYTSYAESKALAEKYILEKSMDSKTNTIVLRPHLIWGKGDPHLFPRVIERARLGKLKRVGEGKNLVDIIHVRNAAKAHIDAAFKLKENSSLNGRVYFIGQEAPVNLWDFIGEVLSRNQIDPVEESVGFKTAFSVGFILEKIYKLFGIIKPEPPMTRFVALQLSKSHYFSHQRAIEDFDYKVHVSTRDGLEEIYPLK